MNAGFYIIMAAQFFSALADNALLIAAIAILRDMRAPAGIRTAAEDLLHAVLRLLAAFVGAFADSMPNGA
jgi:LPLT family lysophospholipid transporter-like MFS transporter